MREAIIPHMTAYAHVIGRKCERVPRYGEQVHNYLVSQATLLQVGHLHGRVRLFLPRSGKCCGADRQVDEAPPRGSAAPPEGSADPTRSKIRRLEAAGRPFPAVQLDRSIAPSRCFLARIARRRWQCIQVLLPVLRGGWPRQVDRSDAACGALYCAAVAPYRALFGVFKCIQCLGWRGVSVLGYFLPREAPILLRSPRCCNLTYLCVEVISKCML